MQAWSFPVRPEGGRSIVSSAAPIVADGVFYFPIGNAVVALDPTTSAQTWSRGATLVTSAPTATIRTSTSFPRGGSS